MRKLVLALFLALILPGAAHALPSITVSWTDNSNNEDGFKVYRAATIAGPFVVIATVPSDEAGKLNVGRTVSHVDANLAYSTQYCYQVTAFNSAGESTPVGPLCATTGPAPITIPMPPLTLTITVNP